MSKKELWKLIDLKKFPDYKASRHGCLAKALDGYEASNLGRIKTPEGEIKHQTQRKDGYKVLSIKLGNKHRHETLAA